MFSMRNERLKYLLDCQSPNRYTQRSNVRTKNKNRHFYLFFISVFGSFYVSQYFCFLVHIVPESPYCGEIGLRCSGGEVWKAVNESWKYCMEGTGCIVDLVPNILQFLYHFPKYSKSPFPSLEDQLVLISRKSN